MVEKRRRDDFNVEIDERTNALIQLFNLILRSVRHDSNIFRESVKSEFNNIVSILSMYIDFDKIDPYSRHLLFSYLVQDVIMSALMCEEKNNGCGENWLRLSPRTKGMIIRCLLKGSRYGLGLSGQLMEKLRFESF
ncbi:MAG: hypothetical protein QW607_10055 [Desulfurococcaceae archaeon]